MTLPRDVHAFRQGQHDYLCGIYSLINTLSYLYDGRVRREKLMYRLLSSYKRRWDLFDLLTLGLDEEQMDHLIGDVLLKGHYARHYPLNFHIPPSVTAPCAADRYSAISATGWRCRRTRRSAW